MPPAASALAADPARVPRVLRALRSRLAALQAQLDAAPAAAALLYPYTAAGAVASLDALPTPAKPAVGPRARAVTAAVRVTYGQRKRRGLERTASNGAAAEQPGAGRRLSSTSTLADLSIEVPHGLVRTVMALVEDVEGLLRAYHDAPLPDVLEQRVAARQAYRACYPAPPALQTTHGDQSSMEDIARTRGPRALTDLCAVQVGNITASIEAGELVMCSSDHDAADSEPHDATYVALRQDQDMVAWFAAIPDDQRLTALVAHVARSCALGLTLPSACEAVMACFAQRHLDLEAAPLLDRRVQLRYPLLAQPPWAEHLHLARTATRYGLRPYYTHALERWLDRPRVLRTAFLSYVRNGTDSMTSTPGRTAMALCALHTVLAPHADGSPTRVCLDPLTTRRSAWTRALLRHLLLHLCEWFVAFKPGHTIQVFSSSPFDREAERLEPLALRVLRALVAAWRLVPSPSLGSPWPGLLMSYALALSVTLSTPRRQHDALELAVALRQSASPSATISLLRFCLPPSHMLHPLLKHLRCASEEPPSVCVHASYDQLAIDLLLGCADQARHRDEHCLDAELRADELDDTFDAGDARVPVATTLHPSLVDQVLHEDGALAWGKASWWMGVGRAQAREWERQAQAWQARAQTRRDGSPVTWRFEPGLEEWVQGTPAAKTRPCASTLATRSTPSLETRAEASSSDNHDAWSTSEDGGEDACGPAQRRARPPPPAPRTPVPRLMGGRGGGGAVKKAPRRKRQRSATPETDDAGLKRRPDLSMRSFVVYVHGQALPTTQGDDAEEW